MAQPKTANRLLMPKATAVWLIDNSALTFLQIAEFVGLTEIEIEALANQDIGKGLVGRNPIDNNELTKDELSRAEADPRARMKSVKTDLPRVKVRAKGPRYTPVSKRGDKPDAIAWLLKNAPDMKDSQICKLVGTTKPTIATIRDRTHPNSSTLRPRHPAEIGLCTWAEYDKVLRRALKAAGKDPDKIKAEQLAKLQQQEEEKKPEDQGIMSAGFDFSNFLSGGSKPQTEADEN